MHDNGERDVPERLEAKGGPWCRGSTWQARRCRREGRHPGWMICGAVWPCRTLRVLRWWRTEAVAAGRDLEKAPALRLTRGQVSVWLRGRGRSRRDRVFQEIPRPDSTSRWEDRKGLSRRISARAVDTDRKGEPGGANGRWRKKVERAGTGSRSILILLPSLHFSHLAG